MANKEDNLIPFDSNQSREQAKINGRKGGIASGLAKKARKTMKEMLDYLLEKEITNKQGEKASTQEAITVSLINQALKGNVKAFEVIRDTVGEKPSQEINLNGDLGVKKVFIDTKTKKKTDNHIDDFIDGKS